MPASHETHAVMPSAAWDLPAGQWVHLAEEASEKEPGVQLAHEADAGSSLNLPAPQFLQVDAPLSPWNAPAGHLEHAVAAADEYVPGMHDAQTPVVVLKSPALHASGEQELEPGLTDAAYVPEQAEQADDPPEAAKLPLAQSVHVALPIWSA